MEIPIGDETLYTLSFADDQVLIAVVTDDSYCILRKLKEEYERWGFPINYEKSEYGRRRY